MTTLPKVGDHFPESFREKCRVMDVEDQTPTEGAPEEWRVTIVYSDSDEFCRGGGDET